MKPFIKKLKDNIKDELNKITLIHDPLMTLKRGSQVFKQLSYPPHINNSVIFLTHN